MPTQCTQASEGRAQGTVRIGLAGPAALRLLARASGWRQAMHILCEYCLNGTQRTVKGIMRIRFAVSCRFTENRVTYQMYRDTKHCLSLGTERWDTPEGVCVYVDDRKPTIASRREDERSGQHSDPSGNLSYVDRRDNATYTCFHCPQHKIDSKVGVRSDEPGRAWHTDFSRS